MESTGKTYKNYDATIRRWYSEDSSKVSRQSDGLPDYSCGEGESL